jgi:NAD(P)H-dependent FMN reductase
MDPYIILAISGSLRAGSSNTALLQVAAALAPAGTKIEFYNGLGDLPHYNPDREDEIISSVVNLRNSVRTADGILICSPEYARGVPGSLKNALDWLVGGIEIVRKPVALINASPYSTHAHAALAIILETMSAQVVPEASVTVPLRGRKLSSTGIAADPVITDPLRMALTALQCAMAAARKSQF